MFPLDHHCSHCIAISGHRWTDDIRLSDLEPGFVCQACGTKGANVRPDFEWDKAPASNVQRPLTMVQQMHTTLRIPLGKTILVGGMTSDARPAATGAPQTLLLIEVTSD